MITSVHNPKIKWVRSLIHNPRTRKKATVFVVEGVRLAEDALAASWKANLVLYDPSLSARGLSVVHAYQEQGAPVELVSTDVMQRISGTESPQGILIVLSKQVVELTPMPDFICVLDKVRDPGNLGTILRSAAATGVEGVFLTQGCTDPFAPKVVRAGMGAQFHLAIVSAGWEEIKSWIRQNRLTTYLADAGKGRPIFAVDFTKPLALIIGGEAFGVGAKARALTDEYIHIPLHSNIESFNVSSAAAILFYEVMRQRKFKA